MPWLFLILLKYDWPATLSAVAALLVASITAYGVFRKRKEEQEGAISQRRFRAFENFHDGLIIVNRDNIIVDANRQARLITAHADLVGKDFRVLIPEDRRPAHEVHAERYHDSPRTRRMGTSGMELELLDRYGRIKPVYLSLTPMEDEYGGSEVIVGIEVKVVRE